MAQIWNHDGYSTDDDSCFGHKARTTIEDATKELGGEKPVALRLTQKHGDSKRTKNILVFASGHRGSTIRNAITGHKYNGNFVGSISEYKYFKVGISSAVVNGYTKDPITCFFDSRAEYLKHMKSSK